jgi:hypothetical protein
VNEEFDVAEGVTLAANVLTYPHLARFPPLFKCSITGFTN